MAHEIAKIDNYSVYRQLGNNKRYGIDKEVSKYSLFNEGDPIGISNLPWGPL